MKTIIILLLTCGISALANEIRHDVERSSDLEKELGYSLSVVDKNDDLRAKGAEKLIPIKGAATEYVVRFQVVPIGKLESLYVLHLTIADGDKWDSPALVQVPLEFKPKFSKKNEVSVSFLIKKELIKNAALYLRCWTGNGQMTSYRIRLNDYVSSLI